MESHQDLATHTAASVQHASYCARTGRIISTAGASANGTARGFSILSLMMESWSSSRVKNCCLSDCTVHSSMLSNVWNSDAEMFYLVSANFVNGRRASLP
jgi:hypothetical protein